MKKMSKEYGQFLLIFICVISFAPQLFAINFLAYGDLRGNFEPCGCDPESDLGGLKRIAYLLDRERSYYKNLLTFDLGNNFSLTKNSHTQNNFLKEGLDLLKPDVSLLNEQEYKHRDKFVGTRLYLLTNTTKKLEPRSHENIKDHFVKGDLIFFAFLSKKVDSKNLLDSKLFTTFIKKTFAKHMNKTKILLFSGSQEELQALQKENFFHMIISSNAKPLPSEISFEEQKYPILLKRSSSPKVVYMVPWGGMGVIRGGDLQFQETKSLNDLFLQVSKQKKQTSFLSKPMNSMTSSKEGNFVTWLNKEYDVHSSLTTFFKSYHEASSKEFDAISSHRLKMLEESKYVGSEKCSTCHQAAFQKWQESKHASAFATLVHKKREKNINCIKCHVLAWEEDGGFVSMKHSPHFINVQCENCHGPRKDHISNPSIKAQKKASKQMCLKCHNSSHSPSFNFETFWSKIHHK